MDKILIILKSDVITAYDIDGSNAVVHKINGEAETYIEDYIDVPKGLKKMYNDDRLSDLAVDVVYTNGDTEILRDFAEELLPCGGFQAFAFEKILPEFLLKSGKLQPGKCVCAEFDGKAYEVKMSAGGEIEMTADDSGDAVSDTDIAAIYKTSFSVFTDSEKQAKLEAELAKVKKNAEEEIAQMKQECEAKEKELNEKLEKSEAEWQKKYNVLQKKCDAYKKKADQWDEAVHKKEDEIKRNRKVVYAKPLKGQSNDSGFFSAILMAAENDTIGINWRIANKKVVSRNDIICVYYDKYTRNKRDINAPESGRLIHLVENGYNLKCEIPIAIIVHPEDSEEEVNRWVEELKTEIKQREKGE